jgi:NAD(P)-dependent dehydrogenase (short-subunit alcohol dehydrogenase family)
MNERKIALVTGANKGIGYRVAERLAAQDMTVLMGSRDRERGAKAVASLPGDVHLLVVDVTADDSVHAAVAEIERRFGRLDILINNAGTAGPVGGQSPVDSDVAVVREVFDTNVFGLIRVSTAMLPLLRRSAAGRIVNLSSDLGSLTGVTRRVVSASTGYAPSKTTVNALTVQYAKALRDSGILVNAAAPGGCDTDLTRSHGFELSRTADDGAAIVVKLATLGPDGPTGGYFNDDGPLPW